MPAGPFSTPLSGLALEMAARNQQQLNQLPATTVAQRAAINKRLTPYGGDLAQYEAAMQAGYEPAVNTLRSTLEAQRDYLVGLPELLLAAQREGVGTGASTAGATPDTRTLIQTLIGQMNVADYLQKVYQPPTVSRSADTQERWSGTPGPATRRTSSRPLTATRLRPTKGNF